MLKCEMTFKVVLNLEFWSTENALYKLSRDSLGSRAICDIPFSQVISPSSFAIKAASPSDS